MQKIIYLLLVVSILFSSCKKKIEGCTDSTMWNYNSEANEDDGTCIPFVYGCSDIDAYNTNADVNTDDNSCIYSFIKILSEQGDWRISTSIIDPPVAFGTGEVTDYLLFTNNCRKDDLITYDFFSELGTYTIREGETKCNPNDPNTHEAGDWEINSDTTIFHITPNLDSTQVWTIKEISDQKFILEGIGDFQGDGITRTLTNTFIH